MADGPAVQGMLKGDLRIYPEVQTLISALVVFLIVKFMMKEDALKKDLISSPDFSPVFCIISDQWLCRNGHEQIQFTPDL